MARAGYISYLALGLFLFLQACVEEPTSDQKSKPPTPKKKERLVATPDFKADSAYVYIAEQVNFGPRVPGTKSHEQCADYLQKKLKEFGCELTLQSGSITTFDNKVFTLKNIIGAYNPAAKKRYLLCAHWDTRPFADQDSERSTMPNDGANDGASGVGVLLEIARQLQSANIPIGVDFIFFDLEDYAKDTEDFCLGSQYWGKHPHVPSYHANYGILLDMVGAKGATFLRDNTSEQYASAVLSKVWRTGAELGYGAYFLNQSTYVLDDHYYINTLAGIPTINIIHMDPINSGFAPSWHTHDDNMDVIDKNTLKAVGQTVMEAIYSEQ